MFKPMFDTDGWHPNLDGWVPPSELLDQVEDLLDECERTDLHDEAAVAEVPRLTKEQEVAQVQLRAELFERGSTFKATKRSEIVGIDNVLGEIEELIHWLRHSEAYGHHKSRLQPGVIFSGSPGTGKTLVSRWIATASDARFINVREFVHKGALFTDLDIRDLFSRARAAYAYDRKPVVLFWDEFENAARERGSDGCTPEQRAVVSQLTAELDGIHGKNEGILLIGCTNYLSSIDNALCRRGRMGLQIEFHAPDRAGKEKILNFYLAKMSTVHGIDLHTLSYFFPNHSTAADIEEACVEAWRHAVRRAIDEPTKWPVPLLAQRDLVKVFIKQLVGPPTTFTIPEEERLPIAIHECGHAICALAFNVPLRLITVQPGKKSLGRVMVDDLNEYISTIPEQIAHMKMGLGGIVAERVAGLEALTGSSSDIRHVNATADHLVNSLAAGENVGIFNMTALGRSVGYSNLIPQISEPTVLMADLDVRKLVLQVEVEAQRAMERVGQAKLRHIAAEVNDRVTMTGKEFRELYVQVCGFEPEISDR